MPEDEDPVLSLNSVYGQGFEPTTTSRLARSAFSSLVLRRIYSVDVGGWRARRFYLGQIPPAKISWLVCVFWPGPFPPPPPPPSSPPSCQIKLPRTPLNPHPPILCVFHHVGAGNEELTMFQSGRFTGDFVGKRLPACFSYETIAVLSTKPQLQVCRTLQRTQRVERRFELPQTDRGEPWILNWGKCNFGGEMLDC